MDEEELKERIISWLADRTTLAFNEEDPLVGLSCSTYYLIRDKDIDELVDILGEIGKEK